MLLTWAASSGLNPTLSLDFLTPVLDGRITASGGANGTRVNSAGVIVAATCPRFDYDPVTLEPKGVLVEEARTNWLRNSGTGGSSPGTALPTNWYFYTPLTGLTIIPVAAGTEGGAAYQDISISGTPSGSGALEFGFDNVNEVAAASGESWAASVYHRLAGGSLAGISAVQLSIQEWTAAASYVTEGSLTVANPSSAGLVAQRVTFTRTLNGGAPTQRVQLIYRLVLSGAAVNITLRIAQPQLEKGAFPTSYIPTVGSAVTRTAGSLTMTGTNFSSWFNASEGTFLSQYVFSNASSGIGMVYEAATDGSNNHNVFRNGTSLVASTTNGAVQQAGFTLTDPVSSGTVYTSAYAYKVNDFAGCLNGGSVQTDISGTLPTVNALGLGVRPFDGSLSLNGWLRSLRYYPRRLTNAQLQVLT